jgi:hypothetical protein
VRELIVRRGQGVVWSVVLSVTLLATGCIPTPDPPVKEDFRGHVAATLALHVRPATKPVVIVPDTGTHPRDKCPTGGWVTQGDGHRTRCTQCDPPWSSEAPVQPDTPAVESDAAPSVCEPATAQTEPSRSQPETASEPAVQAGSDTRSFGVFSRIRSRRGRR